MTIQFWDYTLKVKIKHNNKKLPLFPAYPWGVPHVVSIDHITRYLLRRVKGEEVPYQTSYLSLHTQVPSSSVFPPELSSPSTGLQALPSAAWPQPPPSVVLLLSSLSLCYTKIRISFGFSNVSAFQLCKICTQFCSWCPVC